MPLTPRQQEALDALEIHKTHRAAAAVMGINHGSFGDIIAAAKRNLAKENPHIKPRYRVRADGSVVLSPPRTNEEEIERQKAQQGWAPDYDLIHPVPDGLTLKGTSIRYDGHGTVQQYWNKTRTQGNDPAEVAHLPDPKKIVKVSTLYDQEGRVTQQWVAEKPQDIARERLWHEYAASMAAELPRSAPIDVPEDSASDLLACYPVSDLHIGMLSWAEETGSDYDLDIAETLITSAMDYLVRSAPACESALIAILADWNHYDSTVPETPAHKHTLDADSRYPKMISTSIRAMRYLIAAALKRHKHVHVIIESGNHDPFSAVFMQQCMVNIYENEPRVTIDTSPMHYHYFEFGRNLIGTHHGHGTKMESLPLIMAADRPEAWGRTKHRMWWTAHIHSRKAFDMQGCSVESFRILAAPDAYAAQKGYRSIRDMKAIVLHREHGEVARHTVNPGMFEKAA